MLKQALKLYERLQDIEDERLLAKAWQDCKKEQINQEGQRFDFFLFFLEIRETTKGGIDLLGEEDYKHSWQEWKKSIWNQWETH